MSTPWKQTSKGRNIEHSANLRSIRIRWMQYSVQNGCEDWVFGWCSLCSSSYYYCKHTLCFIFVGCILLRYIIRISLKYTCNHNREFLLLFLFLSVHNMFRPLRAILRWNTKTSFVFFESAIDTRTEPLFYNCSLIVFHLKMLWTDRNKKKSVAIAGIFERYTYTTCFGRSGHHQVYNPSCTQTEKSDTKRCIQCNRILQHNITGFLEFIHNLAGLLEHYGLENEAASILREKGG
jgi:hypothetical protein